MTTWSTPSCWPWPPDRPRRPDRPAAERLGQAAINALLVEHGLAGRVVVRLKGGDPFVFGRGGEEAEALADAGVPFEVVPGVTAAIAGAAFAGIPVTDRRFGATLGLCTGHRQAGSAGDPVDWTALARMSTAVIYMGAGQLDAAAQALIAAGRAPGTPVALVQWASPPRPAHRGDDAGEAAAAARAAGLGAP
ncbi:MAG: SAM-dependent methyltransferase [bacterium]